MGQKEEQQVLWHVQKQKRQQQQDRWAEPWSLKERGIHSMGSLAGRGLADRQPDMVREVAGYGLPGHTNARRDSHGPQSQQEEAKDPWL